MINLNAMVRADHHIRLADSRTASGVQLLRRWNGSACRLSLENTGLHSVRVAEVVAFFIPVTLPPDTPFYGEGYNMLSQYKGTLSRFEDMTNHSDYGHYRFPQKAGFFTVYNLLMLFPREDVILMGFSSCHRFSGEFRFNTENLEVVVDCEDLEVAAGETLELEEFFFASGANREDLLSDFGRRLGMNHKRLPYPEVPTGWCSWYAYGPDVTEQHIFDNLTTIKTRIPQLKFIQIDDGYQKHMGDWLKQHPNFPSPIKDLCLKIKDEGFEPAIWVAPFIAEKDSDLFHEHPDWFIKDDDGRPLPSGDVSFGGWRFAPWYLSLIHI